LRESNYNPRSSRSRISATPADSVDIAGSIISARGGNRKSGAGKRYGRGDNGVLMVIISYRS